VSPPPEPFPPRSGLRLSAPAVGRTAHGDPGPAAGASPPRARRRPQGPEARGVPQGGRVRRRPGRREGVAVAERRRETVGLRGVRRKAAGEAPTPEPGAPLSSATHLAPPPPDAPATPPRRPHRRRSPTPGAAITTGRRWSGTPGHYSSALAYLSPWACGTKGFAGRTPSWPSPSTCSARPRARRPRRRPPRLRAASDRRRGRSSPSPPGSRGWAAPRGAAPGTWQPASPPRPARRPPWGAPRGTSRGSAFRGSPAPGRPPGTTMPASRRSRGCGAAGSGRRRGESATSATSQRRRTT